MSTTQQPANGSSHMIMVNDQRLFRRANGRTKRARPSLKPLQCFIILQAHPVPLSECQSPRYSFTFHGGSVLPLCLLIRETAPFLGGHVAAITISLRSLPLSYQFDVVLTAGTALLPTFITLCHRLSLLYALFAFRSSPPAARPGIKAGFALIVKTISRSPIDGKFVGRFEAATTRAPLLGYNIVSQGENLHSGLSFDKEVRFGPTERTSAPDFNTPHDIRNVKAAPQHLQERLDRVRQEHTNAKRKK